MRALELYSGIGGFAAAAHQLGIEVAGALDVSSHVVEAYNANFEPAAVQKNLLGLCAADFEAYDADIWWMSPPCAPYTRRGNKRDLEDRRAESFLHLLDVLTDVRPRFVALENVEGFDESEARDRLIDTLGGYDIAETILCPTQIGVPNKRPRYYLVAGRDGIGEIPPPDDAELADWRDCLEESVDDRYIVPDDVLDKYGSGFHVMDDTEQYTTCFTGSYGKSWNFTGSYLRLEDGHLRQFTPTEVVRFLGFGRDFRFPDSLSDRQRWKYAGNSLSVPAVRWVLGACDV